MKYGERLPERDIILENRAAVPTATPAVTARINQNPTGIFVFDDDIYVADWDTDKLYAYKFSNGKFMEADDWATLAANSNGGPLGFAFIEDRRAMIIERDIAPRVYGYKEDDKTANDDYDMGNSQLQANGNINPWGLALEIIDDDNVTIYMSDTIAVKIFAYNIYTNPADATDVSITRDEDKDFNLLKVNNNLYPRGIYIDAAHMAVFDATGWIRVYDVKTKLPLPEFDFYTGEDLTKAHLWTRGGIAASNNVLWITGADNTKLKAFSIRNNDDFVNRTETV